MKYFIIIIDVIGRVHIMSEHETMEEAEKVAASMDEGYMPEIDMEIISGIENLAKAVLDSYNMF